MTTLSNMKCIGCEGGVIPLNGSEATAMLAQLDKGWALSADNTAIVRRVEFKGFRQTIEFVNAIAWIVNREKHHPDLKVGYDYCEVLFTTHAINGLSQNDFICAAKVDALFD
ncbi:MAG: 4a-hydroxytetrahydrobiopterin dehydratase [Gammaproteobacteria bacterium]